MHQCQLTRTQSARRFLFATYGITFCACISEADEKTEKLYHVRVYGCRADVCLNDTIILEISLLNRSILEGFSKHGDLVDLSSLQ